MKAPSTISLKKAKVDNATLERGQPPFLTCKLPYDRNHILLRLAEARSILRGRDEGQHHLRVHEVAAKLIQLAQPECVPGVIRISLHVAEIFQLHKRPIGFLDIERLTIRSRKLLV